MPYPTDPILLAGMWTSMLLTLATYSYVLYKDTVAFRFAEHSFMATTFAVAVVVAYQTLVSNAFLPIAKGDFSYIIPIVLGLLLYTLPFKRVRWVSRYPLAIIVGVGTGIAIRGAVHAQMVGQVLAAITLPKTPTPMDWFNFFFSLIAFLTSTSYFVFTKEHKGLFKIPTQIGRYMLMLALGSYFGNTILFRMAMLSGRVEELLKVFGIIPWR
jgi:hypothetical protein